MTKVMTTRRHRFRWVAILASLAIILVSFALQGLGTAGASPTLDGADCWRSGTPLLCWSQYYPVGSVSQLNLFVSDNVQQVYSIHTHSNMQTAINNWSGANGPQVLSFSHQSHEQSYKYIADSSDGHNLTGAFGQTWLCFVDGSCWNALPLPPSEQIIDHINTFINTDIGDQGYIGTLDDSCTQHLFMHEAGHALELAHSLTSSDLMYKTQARTTCSTAISNNDLGDFSAGQWQMPCHGQPTGGDTGDNAGISCIYNWQM